MWGIEQGSVSGWAPALCVPKASSARPLRAHPLHACRVFSPH